MGRLLLWAAAGYGVYRLLDDGGVVKGPGGVTGDEARAVVEVMAQALKSGGADRSRLRAALRDVVVAGEAA